MIFKKFNDTRERYYNNPGNTETPIYTLIQKKGEEPRLEKIGVEDTQAKINSYRDSVDIKKLIERYQLLGDESILNQRPGMFFDATEFPNNVFDMQNLINFSKDIYDNLTPEVKESYSSFEDFVNNVSIRKDSNTNRDTSSSSSNNADISTDNGGEVNE